LNLGLAGKSVLVTGGNRGIGRQIALCFAREGAKVAICGRNREHVESATSEIKALGAASHGMVADLDAEGIPGKIVDEVAAVFGQLDILINNASSTVSGSGDAETLPEAALLQRVVGKGFAAIRCTRAAIPHMRKAGGGRVVFIGGSSARSVLRPREMPLNGSGLPAGLGNSMLVNYARHLSVELAADKILVNVVHPHLTRTDRYPQLVAKTMEQRGLDESAANAALASLLPIGRVIEPEEVADLVVFLCSARASAISGQTVAVDGAAGGHISY
jgi:3-oxoacyl-[acyl-carrier protein] reductase